MPSKWYPTGEARIVPWWFGLMRAEVMQRRDFPDPYGGDELGNGTYQIRWVSAGRLPVNLDGGTAFGFWSTLATPSDDPKFGERSLFRNFISYWSREKSRPPRPAEHDGI